MMNMLSFQDVGVIAGLWVLSVLGSWCNFLTLFYIGFILVHTVPAVIYEKYDAQIDAFAERGEAEFKKQYDVFDAKALETHDKVAEKTETYAPCNILPLDPDSAYQTKMKYPKVINMKVID